MLSLQRNVLVARAAWLVGVCGGDLPSGMWSSALLSLAKHVSDKDLVLALTAVSATMALCSGLMERQHVRTSLYTFIVLNLKRMVCTVTIHKWTCSNFNRPDALHPFKCTTVR